MVRMLQRGFIVSGPVISDMVAALLLAFWALLRVSEYTVPTKDTFFDASTYATRADVRFIPSTSNPRCMIFTVKVSKQDQFRVGHDLIVYPSADPRFCPVAAMRQLFIRDPQPPTAPLFDFNPRTSNVADRHRSMDLYQYIAIFNRVVIAAGLDVSATKTHSLRSGGATAMLRAGVPAYVITKLGRWKSACWQTYTWASHALVQHAHNALGTILPDNTPVDFDAVRRDVTLH